MNPIRAFTITRQKANPAIFLLKKCYIMKHPHCAEEVWNTKIEVKLCWLKDTFPSIIEMYQEKWNVPFLPDIKKGHVVSRAQRNVMNAWHSYHNNITQIKE